MKFLEEYSSHLEAVRPAATTSLLELTSLGTHVGLHTVVCVQVVHTERMRRTMT